MMSATPFNLQNAISEIASTDCDYYKGGWLKTVTRLDKTQSNGCSIVGEFVEKSGLGLYSAGLYLLCDIQGSRKNQYQNYVLVRYDGNKTVEIVTELMDGDRDWALHLWPAIETALSDTVDPREAAIAQIKSLMAEHSITTDDLN